MKMLNIWRLSYDLANKANNLPLLWSSLESTIASFKAKMEYILGLNTAHFKALPIYIQETIVSSYFFIFWKIANKHSLFTSMSFIIV